MLLPIGRPALIVLSILQGRERERAASFETHLFCSGANGGMLMQSLQRYLNASMEQWVSMCFNLATTYLFSFPPQEPVDFLSYGSEISEALTLQQEMEKIPIRGVLEVISDRSPSFWSLLLLVKNPQEDGDQSSTYLPCTSMSQRQSSGKGQ